MTKKLHFETRAIKLTDNEISNVSPVSTPLYLSSTYQRNADGSYNEDFVYARSANPNRTQLESTIAGLEGGAFGFSFSSGMAAISAVLQSLKHGDHVLFPDDIYYAVKQLMSDVCSNWGLTFDLVDMTNIAEVSNAIQENTRLIWIESPSNPLLKITDISSIVSICKKHNLLSCVDNTWATPVLQNPLTLGVDIVMHSSSKYFGGHSDIIGGALVTNNKNLAAKFKAIQNLSGAVPSPFDCWLLTRGIKTLTLRVERQSSNAQELAVFLEKLDGIEQVRYPGLASHPQFKIAQKQYKNSMFGGMLSVLIKGSASRAMEITQKLQLFTTATSLGGVESLIEHRKSVEGDDSKTPENLLRISVGIEHIEDLKNDWKQALT